jgi:hypothetical protein
MNIRSSYVAIPMTLACWTATTWSALFANDDDVYYWRPAEEIILKAPGATADLIADLVKADLLPEETIDNVTYSFCLASC